MEALGGFADHAAVLHRVGAYCKQWTNQKPVRKLLTNEMIRIMFKGKVVRWKLTEDLQTTLQFSTGSGLTANSGPITNRLMKVVDQ